MMTKEARNSYFDNLKGILIFLVVFAHYLSAGFIYSGNYQTAPNALYSLIYMFHMPLFVFVSGYFSKNTEKCRSSAFSQLLLPYLLVNTLCILMDHFILGGDLSNPLFYPYSNLWYLIALFLYRYFAGDLSKLRGSWLWTLLLALGSSLLTPGKNWLLLGNCITFMPFFFLGLETTPDMVKKLRRFPKWLCALVLLAAWMGCYVCIGCWDISITSLGFFNETLPLRLSSLPRVGLILLRYLIAAVLGICLMNLVPETPCFLTKLGRNTMVIFLFHQLPGFRNLLYYLDPFKNIWILSFLWWLIWSLIATWLLGSDLAAKLYGRCMDAIQTLIPRKR